MPRPSTAVQRSRSVTRAQECRCATTPQVEKKRQCTLRKKYSAETVRPKSIQSETRSTKRFPHARTHTYEMRGLENLLDGAVAAAGIDVAPGSRVGILDELRRWHHTTAPIADVVGMKTGMASQR